VSLNSNHVNDSGKVDETGAAPAFSTSDRCLKTLGLNQNPFSMAPDVTNFFSSPRVETIIVEVLQHVESRAGFALLYGDVGLGKTTISRRILHELDNRGIQTALVFNTFYQGAELLREINRDFGLKVSDGGLSAQLEALNRFLLEQRAESRNCVIIIDDAQNLSVESLELVRQISNMETGVDKIVQIILIGQPELEESLNQHSLRQLKSRIALKRVFRPFTLNETRAYVRTKLARSGDGVVVDVTNSALRLVHAESNGMPRRINVIMSRCLFAAVAKKSARITRRIAAIAIRDIEETNESNVAAPKRRTGRVAVAAALLAAAVGAGVALNSERLAGLERWEPGRAALDRIAAWIPAGVAPVAEEPASAFVAHEATDLHPPVTVPVLRAKPAVEEENKDTAPTPAVSPLEPPEALVRAWHGGNPHLDHDTGRRFVAGSAVGPHGAISLDAGRIAVAPPLNPAVLEFLRTYTLERYARRFELALKARDVDEVSQDIADRTGMRLVSLPSLGDAIRAQYATLKVPASGRSPDRYLLFWKPRFWHESDFGEEFARKQAVIQLQTALRQFGTYHYMVDGLAGPQTTNALVEFQRAVGLPLSGAPDTGTLFMIEYLHQREPLGLAQSNLPAVVE